MADQLDFWVGIVAGLWIAVLVALWVRVEFRRRERSCPFHGPGGCVHGPTSVTGCARCGGRGSVTGLVGGSLSHLPCPECHGNG